MAKCIRCGKSGIFLKVNTIGICKNCEYLYGKECQRQAYQNQVTLQPNLSTPQHISAIPKKSYGLNPIESIPVPNSPPKNCSDNKYDFVISELQKQATIQKRNGNLDLAIDCLKRCNELMPYSSYTSESYYLRLVEYLKIAGKFDEARIEEAKIKTLMQKVSKETANVNFKNCSQDLIQVFGSRICPYCSIYHQRIFSKSGTNKNFPSILKLPFDLQGGRCPVCDCYIGFHSYYEYIKDKVTFKNDIEFSNRPFIDDRTIELKRYFEEKQAEKIALERDKADYDWLREHLPNIAPKSFSGYRRMRNLKSENYLKIVELAKENGYLIK